MRATLTASAREITYKVTAPATSRPETDLAGDRPPGLQDAPNPASPGPGCPQLLPGRCDTRRRRSPTSTRINSASWRTKQAPQVLTIYFDGRIPSPQTATITYTEGRTPPSGPVALSLAGAATGGAFARSCRMVRVRLRPLPMATVPRQPTHISEIQTVAAPAAIRPVAIAGEAMNDSDWAKAESELARPRTRSAARC
jgi:hypothetical protein